MCLWVERHVSCKQKPLEYIAMVGRYHQLDQNIIISSMCALLEILLESEINKKTGTRNKIGFNGNNDVCLFNIMETQ